MIWKRFIRNAVIKAAVADKEYNIKLLRKEIEEEIFIIPWFMQYIEDRNRSQIHEIRCLLRAIERIKKL